MAFRQAIGRVKQINIWKFSNLFTHIQNMTMKAFKYIVIAAAAIVAMAACTEALVPDGFASDPNAVRFSATVGEPLTRSNPAGDATTVTQFNAGDKLSIGSDNQAPAVYEFDGTGWNPTSPDNYLTWNSNRQSFTAYYPDTYKGSGNVPQAQNTKELLAAADYMTFEGELEMQENVSFTMARQTARVVINSDFKWGAEYMSDNNASTHRVDKINVHCIGLNEGIDSYHSGNFYALVNPGAAAPDATFITLTVSPLDGQGAPVTHIVKGIPAFQAGNSYTYNITIGKNGVTISNVTVEDWSTGSIVEGGMDDGVTKVFSVSVPQNNFTCVGGSKDYEVSSYVTTGDGSLVALPWTAKFVRKLDDGTYQEIKQGDADYPTWITNFTDKGIGANTKDICTVTVETAEINNNHYYALKNNTPVSGTYNLANATGGTAVENTANCYIVNAPGTYTFPLVYGNAVKNGADNRSAYISTATGDLALETFVNHKNAPITSPYIAAHDGCTPNNAVLVWQDAENLVSNIQFVDGGSPEAHRITFDVAQSTIKQGNAIIAIRDADNTILWSWHIWVTDYKPGLEPTVMASYVPSETQRDKKVKSYDNNYSYTFMGVPLGWCDSENAVGREVLMQFTQPETGQTQEVTIKQDPLSAGANLPYYQWGRKDPMLPSNGLGNDDNDKPYNGNYTIVKNAPGKITVGTAIQNPHVIYNGGDWGYDDWYSAKETATGKNYFQNLWDVNNVSSDHKFTATAKTVYDPSPVGYVVPPSRAFSGLTSDGNNTTDWNKVNTNCLATDNFNAIGGMTFYCNAMNSNNRLDGGVIYFPTTGFRAYSLGHTLRSVGAAGMFWSACSYGSGAGRVMEFSIERKNFVIANATPTAQCAPVRPVRE